MLSWQSRCDQQAREVPIWRTRQTSKAPVGSKVYPFHSRSSSENEGGSKVYPRHLRSSSEGGSGAEVYPLHSSRKPRQRKRRGRAAHVSGTAADGGDWTTYPYLHPGERPVSQEISVRRSEPPKECGGRAAREGAQKSEGDQDKREFRAVQGHSCPVAKVPQLEEDKKGRQRRAAEALLALEIASTSATWKRTGSDPWSVFRSADLTPKGVAFRMKEDAFGGSASPRVVCPRPVVLSASTGDLRSIAKASQSGDPLPARILRPCSPVKAFRENIPISSMSGDVSKSLSSIPITCGDSLQCNYFASTVTLQPSQYCCPSCRDPIEGVRSYGGSIVAWRSPCGGFREDGMRVSFSDWTASGEGKEHLEHSSSTSNSHGKQDEVFAFSI